MTYASYRTAVGTGVAGAVGGRLTDPFASSLACRTVAAACSAYAGCGTAAGMGVDGAGVVGGRAKSPVTAVVIVACRVR